MQEVELQVPEILAFIAELGSHAPLSRIGARFKLKRTYLERAGFVFGECNKLGECNVSPPGSDPPPAVEVTVAASTDKKRPAVEDGGGHLKFVRLKGPAAV